MDYLIRVQAQGKGRMDRLKEIAPPTEPNHDVVSSIEFASQTDDIKKFVEPIVINIAAMRAIVTTVNDGRDRVDVLLGDELKEHEAAMAATMDKFKHFSLLTKKQLMELKDNRAIIATIRNGLVKKYASSFSSAVRDYNDGLTEYKKVIVANQRRKITQIADGKLSEEKITKIIEEGNAQQFIQEAMSEELSDVIASLEERHKSILHLERSVREVQELFVNLATLVNFNQDLVDSIETHIHNAKQSVVKAEVNLIDAEKEQASDNKKKCCILGIIIVILVVIIAPVVVQVTRSS